MAFGAPEISAQASAWINFLVASPLLLAAGIWDLRRMLIPNWLNLALVGMFLAAGLLTLPMEEVAWRFAGGLLVLTAGFAFFSLGRMGGGDVKMMAACALFVPLHHAGMVLQILAFSLAVGLAGVHLGRWVVRWRHRRGGDEQGRAVRWRALRPGAHFPMGISIALAMLVYLGALAALEG